MRRLRVLLSVVAVVTTGLVGCSSGGHGGRGAPSSHRGDAWPTLGRDLASTFHNPQARRITTTSAGKLRQAWKLDAAGAVNGAPALVGDAVFALSQGGLYALDASDGTTRWRAPSITGSSSPSFLDGRVYVMAANSVVHAVAARDGRDLWHTKVDDQPKAVGYSSPVVAGDLVIVGCSSVAEVSDRENSTYRGSVVALDRRTGAVVWRHFTVDPPFNGVAVWSSVSVDEATSTVFASTGNNYTEAAGPTSDSIMALDLRTGSLRWSTQTTRGDVFTIPNAKSPDSDFGTNPVLFEARVGGTPRKLVGGGQKNGLVSALDRTTGAIVWQRRVSGGSALIGGVFNNGAFDGRHLLVAGNDGNNTGAAPHVAHLVALDPADGRVAWTRTLDDWVWAPITLAGGVGAHGVGFVAVGTNLEAFDTSDGRRLARFATAGTITSAPAVAGGHVVFGSGVSYFGGTKPGQSVYSLAVG